MKNLTLLFLVLFQLLSCGDNRKKVIEDMNSEDYLSNGWEAMTCSAIGYPIIVYSGGFVLKNNDMVGLYSASITASKREWGNGGGTMNHGSRAPYRLEATWISLAEDCEYSISTDIDHKKIKEIFDRASKVRGASMNIRKERFNEIIAGFAPSGVVIVWVGSIFERHEIGRYQGKKVKIPQEAIDRLDNSEKIWFDKAYRKELLERPALVTDEWREKNQGKPIQYGLWDRYRQTYCYKPIITLPEGSEIYDVQFRYYNGERKEYLYPEQIDSVYVDNVIPRYINVLFTNKKGEDKGAKIIFNEEEVFRVFEEFSPTDKLEMEFYVSKGDLVTVYLHCKEKGITHRGLSVFPEEREVYEPVRKLKR